MVHLLTRSVTGLQLPAPFLSLGEPIPLTAASPDAGARHPEGAGQAEAAENDAGADPDPVHVCVQSAHPVPEELQAHIGSRRCRRARTV